MRDKNKKHRRIANNKLIFIGIGLGGLFWFIEAAVHAFIFDHANFPDEILYPDPHETWMRSLVVCLFIIFGSYAQFIVNSRKRAQKALKESEQRLKTILDSAQVGILTIDAKSHKIAGVNPMAAEMIGAPKEQIIGHVCHSFVCPAQKGKCPITDLGQIIDNSERVLLKCNGKEMPILKTVGTVSLGGREYLIESFLDITERKQAADEREKLIKKLQDALGEVKTLSGLLPICASCKKIRDDKGYWNQIESYIRDHSEAEFSHSLCPECLKKLYPELDRR
ncbi:MAG: PAS domain-containing protein [Pseudomonadota bacterium]